MIRMPLSMLEVPSFLLRKQKMRSENRARWERLVAWATRYRHLAMVPLAFTWLMIYVEQVFA